MEVGQKGCAVLDRCICGIGGGPWAGHREGTTREKMLDDNMSR